MPLVSVLGGLGAAALIQVRVDRVRLGLTARVGGPYPLWLLGRRTATR
ncbi:hypothetical protein [Streptomyces bicolor]|nr:hypothetical protein [Streptomyces bicolor]